MPAPRAAWGRIYAPDARDRQYPMRAQLAKRITPRSMFWEVGPILDQGDTPQCVAYSAEQFLQTTPLATMDGPRPAEIYTLAQQLDEWPGEAYDGTSVRGGAKALTQLGRLKSYVWASGVLDVRDWIITKGPVMMGSVWLEEMFWPDAAGILHVGGAVAGGHAYLITGYDVHTNMFKMANSWGAGWGVQGSAWLKARDVGRLISKRGEACAAVEQLVTPVAAPTAARKKR